jgi:hypothetical protein
MTVAIRLSRIGGLNVIGGELGQVSLGRRSCGSDPERCKTQQLMLCALTVMR